MTLLPSIITNPCLTDAGLPDASIYIVQPILSVRTETSCTTLHCVGLKTKLAPHSLATSVYTHIHSIQSFHCFNTFQLKRSNAINILGDLSLAAATIPIPRAPQPEITTTSLHCISAKLTACTEQAKGSIKAPFQGGILLGT